MSLFNSLNSTLFSPLKKLVNPLITPKTTQPITIPKPNPTPTQNFTPIPLNTRFNSSTPIVPQNPSPQIAPVQPTGLSAMESNLKNIQDKINQVTNKVKTEGVTNNSGQMIINPETGGTKEPPVAPVIPQPVVPQNDYTTSPGYEEAAKAYESALPMTPEEIANQEQINKFQEATTAGILGEGERPIPMGFITGRQRAIEQRGLALQQPLSAQAALLQAKRTAALEASKFKLGLESDKLSALRENAKAQQTAQQEATKQAESIRQFNQTFGFNTAKTAQEQAQFEKTATENQREFDVSQALEREKLAATAGAKTDQESGAIALKQDALTSAQDLLTKLITGKGTAAVGKTNIFQIQNIPGTAAADFKVQFNNLKSLLSLSNVSMLKGQGQVSDAERKLLSEASAKLELSQTEGEFKKALQDIVTALQGKIGNLPPTMIFGNQTFYLQGDGTYK
jgi:hypothetical protein